MTCGITGTKSTGAAWYTGLRCSAVRNAAAWGGVCWVALAADVDVVVIKEAVSSVESAVNKVDDAIRRARVGASGGLEGAVPTVDVSHNRFGDVVIRDTREGVGAARPWEGLPSTLAGFAGNRAGDVTLRRMGDGFPRAWEVGDGAAARRRRIRGGGRRRSGRPGSGRIRRDPARIRHLRRAPPPSPPSPASPAPANLVSRTSTVSLTPENIPKSPVFINMCACSTVCNVMHVTPSRACNMSNCSSRDALHFVQLHHVH